jgi:hypothetical protein
MTAKQFNPNRLFVYGIFLGEDMRNKYGMSNPRYATVPGFATMGDYIVQAFAVANESIQLTGLIVDIDPYFWEKTDRLESNYDRIKVITSMGESVWSCTSEKY